MPKTTTTMEPTSKDYLIDGGPETERHRGNLLVHDMISLHAKLWLLAGSKVTKSDETQVAKHIVDVVHNGSAYTLPSSITTSESFFTGGGRFLKKEGDDSWTEISDAAAVKLLTEQIHKDVEFLDSRGYGKEPAAAETKTGDETESGKSPGKRKGKAKSDANAERFVTTKPNIDDVVLLDRTDSTEKTYVDHAGNAYLVLEVSQFFTEQYMLSRAAIKGTRADAALATVYSLLGSAKDVGLDGSTSTKTRFLVRPKGTDDVKEKSKDGAEVWEVLTYGEAAEYVLTLLFDKLVDKENIAAVLEGTPPVATATATNASPTVGPSTTPIKNFTEHDVLFGRGGLTNSHPGNRRFRDIILLHRPDYIRAIKIEKPNVARRIVRAIRCGSPPGRFLKKDRENGLWYDVGDRHAAEKTSQALREKTQAEKAARFDEDKRKRLRDGGLSQLASQKGVRSYPLLPLPALSPADLQRMVQSPYAPQMAGMAVMGSPFVPVAAPPSKSGDKTKAKDTPNGTKQAAAAASLPPEGINLTAVTVDNGKIASNQRREDENGNILVTDSDVIAGRGGRSNHHVGNKRFRDIVALHRPDYIRAAKIHKPAVSRMIVRALRNSDPPGRFLKKDEKTGKWYDIGDKKAAEKASQALREKTQEERDRLKQDPSGLPPSYFANTALFNATAAMIKGVPGLGSPIQPSAPAAAVAPEEAKADSESSPSKKGDTSKETAEV